MKFLGSVTDPKDIATKEYVDSANKPEYRQTFTSGGTYTSALFDIPYDESYTAEELGNVKMYHYTAGESYCEAGYWKVYKYTYSDGTVWRYYCYFYGPISSGATVVFENPFTDTDAVFTGISSM